MPEYTDSNTLTSFEAKVASIIDDFRVVINKGESDDINVGHRFLVIKIGDEIFDPDTNESLGRVEIVKGKGKVTHIQNKMATLQTIEKHEIKRKASSIFAIAAGTQEVSREPKAFIDPEVGDIARLL